MLLRQIVRHRTIAIVFAISALLAGGAAYVIAGAMAGDSDRTPANLDSGLSDAERDAKYRDLEQRSTERQLQVVRDFVDGNYDLSDLERVPLLVESGAPDLDADEAATEADVVAYGTVTHQEVILREDEPFQPRIVSTISVERWLKGENGTTSVSIEQIVRPSRNADGVYSLGILEDDPLLDLGHEYVVFARMSQGGRLESIPNSTLSVVSGSLEPVSDNAQLSVLDGKSVEDLVSSLMPN